MGSATSGQPGESWAYRVLPLDVPPPDNSSGRVGFASAVQGSGAQGQLVFERATDADPEWTIQETPLAEGQPYRGIQPNRLSARITPHGGGVLVGQDSSRSPGQRIVVLTRDPAGRFQAIPEPPAGIVPVAGEDGDPQAGTIVENEGAGAVADAAVENGSHTEAFFGVLGRRQDTAVIRWDGTQS